MRNIQNESRRQQSAGDVNDRLIFSLRHLGHTIRFALEGKGSQSRILMILREAGSITQSALTERLGIRPGSASEVIAKLERAGLVQRTPHQEDRRTADLCLTPEGLAEAERAAADHARRLEAMFSCLTDPEKEALLCTLEKLRADWEERFEGDGHPPRCPHHPRHPHHPRRDRPGHGDAPGGQE